MLSEVEILSKLPPLTVISPATKSVVASLKVKVMVAVSPATRSVSSVVIAKLGDTVELLSVKLSPVPLLPSASV